MAFTPNKGYNNQTTGTDTGTWGLVLNQNFSTIDANLGGTLDLSVAGGSNVTLSAAQAENLIYNFSGILTGNINVIFPTAGGLYFINNQTTGGFTLTIQAGTSVNGFLIPQGTQVPIYVDNSTTPPTIGGAAGTQYVYTAASVTGTANAVVIPATLPTNFTLEVGELLTFTTTQFNTGSVTLQTPDGSVIPVQKLGATGLVNLQAGDLDPGTPTIAQYNGSVWIGLNILYYGTPTQASSSFTLTFSSLYVPYIATTAINVTLNATSSFGPVFNCYFLAEGGSITLIPNGTDNINGVNANFIIPQGSSGKLNNDGAGNWWVYFVNAPLNSPVFTGIPEAPTAVAGTSTTQLATTAFVNATALTLANGTTAVTQAPGDNSTAVATDAFVNPAGTVVNTTPGNVVFPSGFILKYGRTGVVGSGSTASITFGTPFPNDIWGVFLTVATPVAVQSPNVQSSSATGFVAGNPAGGTATVFNWLAIGN